MNTAAQELVTPPDILSMMTVWLSEAVAGFSSRSQAARLPSSVVAPPSCCPPVHVSPPHSSFRPQSCLPSKSVLCCVPFPSSAPFPFCISAASFCHGPRRPPCCLRPFCPTSNSPCFFQHTGPPPFHHFACWGPLFDTSVGVWPTSVDPFSGDASGPVRPHCDRHDQ